MNEDVEHFLDLVGMKLAIRRMAETGGFKTYDSNTFQIEANGHLITMIFGEECLELTTNKDYELLVLAPYVCLYNSIAVEHISSIKECLENMVNLVINNSNGGNE